LGERGNASLPASPASTTASTASPPPVGEELMAGRFYDEWTVGDRLEHQPHRTVTETDNLLISR
jgi:acyl dehydratase